ncbi:TrmH family RNA methyltransferase [Candidatus Ulvibacter alkanivorans]|uniref:TrmH family RNA methyltransferase n=1 Tax=Candidatus Ulvibacter alkanivorans TaxID=2267620 RepID=UPI000DF15D3F|nr:RNA methyltransferase [Candidatus Ulvibacter alkanivorans]
MISKGQIKLITSLQQKKYRDKTGLFIAEGPKVIQELVASGVRLHSLFSTETFEDASVTTTIVTAAELQKISALTTANTALAVFEKPEQTVPHYEGLTVALDAIRDPGNLGTIIRLCDWFGIQHLICSTDTADCYNPKVVQATMGSLARVTVSYVDLKEFLQNAEVPIYGAMLQGTNVYTAQMPTNAILVMGNESRGVSEAIQQQLTHRLTIPQFGTSKDTESLNVATATAILVSEFRRATGR